MGLSIGELFVSLGFDVDDSKLKSFDDTLKSAYGTALKIAGIGGGVAGFVEIANNAGKTAVSLRDLNTQFGISYDSALKFAAQWSAVNPFADMQEGFSVIGNLAKYRADMLAGKAGNEFAMFGGSLQDDTPDKMLARLRSGYGLALQTNGGNAALVSGLLEKITGSRNAINYVQAGSSELDSAGKLADLRKQEIDDTVRAAEALRNLHTAWDNFLNHMVASLAPHATDVIDASKKGGFWGAIAKIGEWNPFGFSPHMLSDIGENDFYGVGSGGKAFGEWMRGGYASMQIKNARNGSGLPMGLAAHNPGNLQPYGIEAQYGSDAEGLAAMANNLRRYGRRGWNTIDSIISHWAPAAGKGNSKLTEAAYKAALASALGIGADQKLNLNDPATLEKLMAPMIKQEQGVNPFSAKQLADAAGDTTNNVTINVHSNGDAQEVAEKTYQKFIDVTYPTRDTGAAY